MIRKIPALLLAFSCIGANGQVTVFGTDFEGPLPSQIAPGSALLTPVEGYAGLNPAGAPFAGSFLRSVAGNTVTLSLTGLPVHSSLDLGFLFAAIDSLDGGRTYPAGDFFTITLDGNRIFRESFANALPSQFQSYVPPPGVQLARHENLGFRGPGSYYTDSAYDLAADPVFASIPHSGSSATFTFLLEGNVSQGLNDESWAMDNLRVGHNGVTPVPEPETHALLLAGLAAVGWLTRRRRSRS
jgi:hypothetical protein